MIKKLSYALLIALALVALTGSYILYNNKIEAQSKESYTAYQKSMDLKAQEHANLLEELGQKKDESFLSRVQYLSAEKGKVNISVLGSSVTAGAGATTPNASWKGLLNSDLDGMDGVDVRVFNNGYGGYTTSDIIANEKIAEVVTNEPDIVIFELCLLNNNGSEPVLLEQTKKDVDFIMNTLEKELPEALIIVQTANPFSGKNVVMKKTGYSYDEYNLEMKDYVDRKGWNFIDTYSLMERELKNQKLEYKDILDDNIHPNNDGYKLWFDVMKPELESKLVDI